MEFEESKILYDFDYLIDMIKQYLFIQSERCTPYKDVEFFRKELEGRLKKLSSIVLLPPEGSPRGICPTCGHQL